MLGHVYKVIKLDCTHGISCVKIKKGKRVVRVEMSFLNPNFNIEHHF